MQRERYENCDLIVLSLAVTKDKITDNATTVSVSRFYQLFTSTNFDSYFDILKYRGTIKTNLDYHYTIEKLLIY